MEQKNKTNEAGIIAVNASAGTGKTYALSKYYLNLLLNSDQNNLKNIIAITFTKKATKEMKERIIEFIKEVAFGTDKAKEVLELKDIPSACQKKAAEVMDYLIKNYNFFQVQTIDSFVNTILQSCAINLSLSSHYQTKTDNKDYLLYGLESAIDKALTDTAKKALFDEFLKTFLMSENRVSWFPKGEIFEVMKTLNTNMNNFGKEFMKLERGTSSDIRELKDSILDDMEALSNILPKGTNGTFKNSFETFMAKIGRSLKSDDIPNGFGKKIFPVNKGGTIPAKVNTLWDSLRRKITELCKKEAYSFYNCYIDIFRMVDEEFRKVSEREDILFLNEFNKRASKLFESGQSMLPELYYRLATRFKHLLIDEFQDTSTLQWENLKEIVDEILGNGGNLFYVGDKKQAIYSFRGGNAELFDKVKNSFYKVDSRPENLKLNWRSQKEIVEFNNGIFSKDNLSNFLNCAKMDLDEKYKEAILNVFSEATEEYLQKKAKGYVNTEYIAKDDEEGENTIRKKTLGFIKNCLERGYSKNDIAVLCRTNKDVETVTNWLLEEKYSVESEKTLSLRENSVIKELISFLMYLNSPIDNTAFASFIMGKVFAETSGLSQDEVEKFIFNANEKLSKHKDINLYKEFRDRYPQIWDKYFEPFFTSAGMLPFYEVVISIYSKFNIMENFSDHHIFLAKFLELIKEQSLEKPGLGHFIDYFMNAEEKDLYINSSKADAVNVLTMHVSKGLEFPVVIIPYFEISVKRDNEFYGVTENGMLIIKLKEKYEKLVEELGVYSMKNRKENLINELNTAYVALTRAAEELYIMHSPKAGSHNNLAKILLGDKDTEAGARTKFQKKPKEVESVINITVPRYADIIETLRDEYVEKDELHKREEFLYGKAMHLALSFIGSTSGKNIDNLIENAVSGSAAVYGNKNSSLWQKKIKSILENAELKHFFQVEGGEILREKEIITKEGATKIIDRLIVSPKEVMIIDYKSTPSKKDEHVAQVKEYCSAITEIYPGRTVKGYILYLDSEQAIEVK